MRALRWRPWVGWSIVVGALILGVAVDRIGGAQRVNLLAPPVFALLAWNLGVYVALAVGVGPQQARAVARLDGAHRRHLKRGKLVHRDGFYPGGPAPRRVACTASEIRGPGASPVYHPSTGGPNARDTPSS